MDRRRWLQYERSKRAPDRCLSGAAPQRREEPAQRTRRSYSRLHAIIADSASFANSADRFANNFASDKTCHFFLMRFKLLPRLRRALLRLLPLSHRPFEKLSHTRLLLLRCKDRTERWLFELPQ